MTTLHRKRSAAGPLGRAMEALVAEIRQERRQRRELIADIRQETNVRRANVRKSLSEHRSIRVRWRARRRY